MEKNTKAIEILNKYIKTKRDDYSSAFFDHKLELNFNHSSNHEELKEIGPFNEKEAFRYRKLDNGADKYKSAAISIDPRLYNKRFLIGDFEINVIYKESFKVRPTYSNSEEYNSSGYKNISGDYRFDTKVYLRYRGHYKKLLDSNDSYLINAAYCKPTQTNWYHVKPTEEKPYILKELIIRWDYDYKISFFDELFSSIDIDSLELKDSEIQMKERYSFSLSQREREENDKIKPIHDFIKEELEFEWFVQQEIKDGVYRPEGVTISKWIYDGFPAFKNDKNLLKKLGVHTVQLKSDAHFNVPGYYNMSGISIKAPKKVVERYGFEKYCENKEIVKKIKEEKEQRKQEYKAREYNSKFTLMQHGKVIKNNVDYDIIIDYLNNFVPSSKMPTDKSKKTSSNIEDEIIKCIKPVFDDFPTLDKFYIAYWGTYSKYELRGKTKDIDYDCDYLNSKIDDEMYSQITELYSDNIYPHLDEKIVSTKFGWPDAGAIAIGVERNGETLCVFTEDYDFE